MAAQDWAHAGISLRSGTLNIEEGRGILMRQLLTVQLVDGEGSAITIRVYFIVTKLFTAFLYPVVFNLPYLELELCI